MSDTQNPKVIERDYLGGYWVWFIYHETRRKMYSANVKYQKGDKSLMYYGPLCRTVDEVQNLKTSVIQRARAAFEDGALMVTDRRVVSDEA